MEFAQSIQQQNIERYFYHSNFSNSDKIYYQIWRHQFFPATDLCLKETHRARKKMSPDKTSFPTVQTKPSTKLLFFQSKWLRKSATAPKYRQQAIRPYRVSHGCKLGEKPDRSRTRSREWWWDITPHTTRLDLSYLNRSLLASLVNTLVQRY